MRPINNLFYIEARHQDETKYVLANGLEIYISPPILPDDKTKPYSPYERAVQIGKVAIVPHKITGMPYDTEVVVGDIVCVHHFTIAPENMDMIDGKQMYRTPYFNIFCIIRDGEIICCHDYLFCEPVVDLKSTHTPSGIFLSVKPKEIPLTARILYACKSAASHGLYPGDVIKFEKDSDYWLEIGKKRYWRISIARVSAKVIEVDT